MVTGSTAAGDVSSERSVELARVFSSEERFRAFYDRALPRIYGYLINRCGGDASIAEDLTQQTFTEAVRQRHTFDGRADALTWLTAIARHKLADHYRRRSREEHRRLRLVVREIETADEGRAWRGIEEREAILRALRMLPPLHRVALVLRYADGLSVREISAELARSESSTESLLTRARQAFRKHFEESTDG